MGQALVQGEGHFKLRHLLTIPMKVARTRMETQTWSSCVRSGLEGEIWEPSAFRAFTLQT